MKTLILWIFLPLILMACSHDGSSDSGSDVTVPSHVTDHDALQCPALNGTFQNDNDPTITLTYKRSEGSLVIQSNTGTGEPPLTVNGVPQNSLKEKGQEVAYCANGKIYLEGKSTKENIRAVISKDNSGYSLFIENANNGNTSTIHFTQIR